MAEIVNIQESWEGHSGLEVEQFIKEQFGGKVGYLYRSSEKEEDGLFHVRGFASQQDYEEWAIDKDANAEKVVTHFTIPDTASTTASYVLQLVNGSSNYIVSTDGKVILKLRFVSVMYSPIDQSTSDTGEAGLLTIQTRSNNNDSWATKGTIHISSMSKDSTEFTDVDISQYLSDGQQEVRVIVRGETSDASTNYVSATVVKTVLSLSFASDWQNPIRNAALTPQYRINGSIEKTLNLVVDGVRTFSQYIGASVYVETPYSFPTITDSEYEQSPVCTQGIHTIEAWLSVDKDGTHVESEHIYSQLLVILDDTKKEHFVILNNVAKSLTNWTEQKFFDYAVYNSEANYLPLTFEITNNDGTTIHAQYPLGDVEENKVYSFSNMLELEEARLEFPARLRMRKTGEERILQEFVVAVDNTQNFSPTEGADFIFNPKLRSNQETHPATIINAVTGEEVAATFKNFGFLNDAYTTDEQGNKCFRVLAGDELHITGYEAFQDFLGSTHTNSLTMEFDFAVRNVTNEDETLLRMCTYDNNNNVIGWEMKPLSAMFGTMGLQVRLDQDIAWSENKRTHVVVNIVNNLAGSGLNYIRIFINGKINREMSYLSSDTFVQYVGDTRTSQGIRIGAAQSEIDIYSIRIYRKALSSTDVMTDYVASLPTLAEKLSFRDANNVMVNNLINYGQASAKYNTLLWKPNASTDGICRLATYGDDKDLKQNGDLVVSILGDDKHSGTLHNMTTKGQGTSSMSYWKWNQRFEFADGGYFENLLGERFEKAWQIVDGAPFASRNDAKLNWASSQQSHKMGATALYNDCWKKIIKNNTITLTSGGQSFTGTEGGYADCRVAVRQKSFFMFVQKDAASEPEFYGMFTFGSGKGDKPTFGYDKSTFPDFTMLEGCDNDKPLVMHRVPFDNSISMDSKGEIYLYNGEDNWEIAMGSGNLASEFIEAFNFVYLHHLDIAPYEGTYTQLVADSKADTSKDLWVTDADTSAAKYDLFRYDIIDKRWVPAGLNKTTLNINQQCGGVAAGVDYDKINEQFRQKRLFAFRPYDLDADGKKVYRTNDGVEKYYHTQDALFTMMFLRLVAATDNRGKNTYLYKAKAGDKIMFFQDDLDSIFLTDNVGRKTKPYYIEEHDRDTNNRPYWNSERNAFYNLMEAAFVEEMRTMTNSILTAMAELGGGTVEGCLERHFYSTQENIPAVAYNEVARLLYEDAAKAMADGRYQNNTLPLPQCLGDQLESEREWLKKRIVYLSSYASHGEFAAGEVSGALAFRSILTTDLKSPRYTFTIVPHQWIYPANGTGDSVFPSHTRVRTGESYTFPERTSDGNTNVRINGVNYLRSVGEFGDKSAGEAFSLSGARLTHFSAASTKPEFRPTSMKVSAPNLESLDLSGISTLTGVLDLSGQKRLHTINLSGTSFTSVVLPSSDTLTTVILPATLTSLTITEQPNLRSVTIEGTDYLQTIRIDHRLAKNFNSASIAYNLYTSYTKTGIAPKEIVMNGIQWTGAQALNHQVLMWLTESVANCSLTGVIEVAETTSTVQSNITYERKVAIVNKWGNVDDAEGEGHKGLILQYRQIPLTSFSIIGNYYYSDAEGGAGNYPFIAQPNSTYSNDFVSLAWSAEGINGGEIVTDLRFSMNTITGVLTIEEAPTLEWQVENMRITISAERIDGSIVASGKELRVFQRKAQLGDLVYADGTFGPVSEDDGKRTPIGVCFYVAPTDTNGDIIESLFNPNDKHKRLMVALEDVSCQSKEMNYTSSVWGAYPGTDDKNSLFYTDETAAKKQLSVNGLSNLYDIPTIANIGTIGIDGNTISTSNFRDSKSQDYGFKCVRANLAMGDGFAYDEDGSVLEARTIPVYNNDGSKNELLDLVGNDELGKPLYQAGDIVNSGYIKTLKIIQHRNHALAMGISDVNLEAGVYPRPVAGGGFTELDSLCRLMDEISKWFTGEPNEDQNPNKWKQLYWPAASAAYAYQPKVKAGHTLDARFKAHNWFLPTVGMLARIYWYTKVAKTLDDGNIFAPATGTGEYDFKVPASSYYWSCTENSSYNSWSVYFNNGNASISYKYYNLVVRAVAAF